MIYLMEFLSVKLLLLTLISKCNLQDSRVYSVIAMFIKVFVTVYLILNKNNNLQQFCHQIRAVYLD